MSYIQAKNTLAYFQAGLISKKEFKQAIGEYKNHQSFLPFIK